MKKIVAYVGSMKDEVSNTYKFTEAILNKSKEKYRNIDFEIITSKDFTIKPCVGCKNCFVSGICALDKEDDAGKIKDKLLSADMVIFASCPDVVYFSFSKSHASICSNKFRYHHSTSSSQYFFRQSKQVPFLSQLSFIFLSKIHGPISITPF